MPKQRIRAKVKGTISKNVQNKFRIGSRSGGKSALRMTDKELLGLLEGGGTRKRDLQKIRNVLTARGVTL